MFFTYYDLSNDFIIPDVIFIFPHCLILENKPEINTVIRVYFISIKNYIFMV